MHKTKVYSSVPCQVQTQPCEQNSIKMGNMVLMWMNSQGLVPLLHHPTEKLKPKAHSPEYNPRIHFACPEVHIIPQFRIIFKAFLCCIYQVIHSFSFLLLFHYCINSSSCSGLSLCCCDKTANKSNWERKGFIWLKDHSPSSMEAKAGYQSRNLWQECRGHGGMLLMSCFLCLLSSPSYTAQNHLPRDDISTAVWAL